MRPIVPGRGAAGPGTLFAVVAAHRTGQPLHAELVAVGGRFVRCAATAAVYRLLALPGGAGGVARGGIVRVPSGGAAVEVELHELPGDGVQALARVLPEPLAIEPVQLASGSPAVGIICRRRPVGALDITEHGSWPAYLAARDPVSGRTTSTAAG
jgi:allophanate hydrolase